MTRLVLAAHGKEKLKFNSARGKDENEVASLPGGHRIDVAREVRFGILGESVKQAAKSPFITTCENGLFFGVFRASL
jgi:hypothetical protein